jgi:hypothetical protein
MAWKKENINPRLVGGTGQTPFSKSPPINHPQIEWLNKVQSSMKKDIELSKKCKLKTLNYSGQKDN